MKYLVYPIDYDPMIAAGPPDKRSEVKWTPQDTERHRQMEKDAKIVEGIKPNNVWLEKICTS